MTRIQENKCILFCSIIMQLLLISKIHSHDIIIQLFSYSDNNGIKKRCHNDSAQQTEIKFDLTTEHDLNS